MKDLAGLMEVDRVEVFVVDGTLEMVEVESAPVAVPLAAGQAWHTHLPSTRQSHGEVAPVAVEAGDIVDWPAQPSVVVAEAQS